MSNIKLREVKLLIQGHTADNSDSKPGMPDNKVPLITVLSPPFISQMLTMKSYLSKERQYKMGLGGGGTRSSVWELSNRVHGSSEK